MSFFAGVAQAVKEWDQQKYETKEREETQKFRTGERLASERFQSEQSRLDREVRAAINEAQMQQDKWNLTFGSLKQNFDTTRTAASQDAAAIQLGASLLGGDIATATILHGTGQLPTVIENIQSNADNIDPQYIPLVIEAAQTAFGGDDEALTKAVTNYNAAIASGAVYVGEDGAELLLKDILAMDVESLTNVRVEKQRPPAIGSNVDLPSNVKPWSPDQLGSVTRQVVDQLSNVLELTTLSTDDNRTFITTDGANPVVAAAEKDLVNNSVEVVRNLSNFIPLNEAVSQVSSFVNEASLISQDKEKIAELVLQLEDVPMEVLLEELKERPDPESTPEPQTPSGFSLDLIPNVGNSSGDVLGEATKAQLEADIASGNLGNVESDKAEILGRAREQLDLGQYKSLLDFMRKPNVTVEEIEEYLNSIEE